MKYDVWLTEQAEREIHAAADWVWEHSPNASDKWFNGFVEALQSLEFPSGLADSTTYYRARCIL